MKSPIIEVKNLTKKYGKFIALNDINLEIEKGEIFGLVGPNAAGKSTFISILTGLIKPTGGDIFVKGFSVLKNSSKIKSLLGYVPQDVALYPMLSGLDNLNFWAGIYGLKGQEKKKRINDVLSIVQLEDRARQKVDEYSGGMKRRLNIAVALIHNPEIIIMDEPVVGVDVLSKKFILDALKDLKKSGRTILITSHYINELAELCDRIALLDRGRIKMSGQVKDILKHYGTENLEEVMISVFGGYHDEG
jgi:ABC-2 type transport system ATP-binding protein